MSAKPIDNQDEIKTLIDKSEYAVLSMCDDGAPYAVPLNAAWDGEYFYLHSGHSGRKIEVLKKNPKVFLSFVPEAAFVQRREGKACGASMNFKSICVSGLAEVLGADSSLEERRAGLLCIARHFGAGNLPMDEAVLAKTTLIRVKPKEISGLCKPDID